MAKIIVTLDGNTVGEYNLEKDTTTLGRNPGNDIQVNESTVSGTHAKIVKQADGSYVIEDSGSTNGILVNGNKVLSHPLVSGEVLQVGKAKLSFSGDGGAHTGTVVMSADMLADGRVIALKHLSGPKAGEVKVLSDGKRVQAGTRNTCYVDIYRRGDDGYVVFMGGPQLPRVNGKRLGVEKHLLQDQDKLEVGPDIIEVTIK
jgi:pSer/pThr/pTyr-binding forkhead associated (FHA) protein